jgi:hypothetical protein
MQTRRTNLNHHQTTVLNEKRPYSCPEAELIALARSKGQVLAENTLRIIRETLELRGVGLPEFIADVRPHFRNNILNPSGFLINRARQFHHLSPAAVESVPSTSVQPPAIKGCEVCSGQRLAPRLAERYRRYRAARCEWEKKSGSFDSPTNRKSDQSGMHESTKSD